MTTGVVLPLVVLVHSHAPHLHSLALALAEAGSLGQRFRTLALDPPDGDDGSWILDQVDALLRGPDADAPPRLTLVDSRWEVTYDGRPLALTSTQYRLMRALLNTVGETVLVHDLAAAVFGSSYHDRERIAAHVKRLRRRLVEQGVGDYRLEAVRGVGYRLVPDRMQATGQVGAASVPG